MRENILKLFLITIIITGTISFVYADSGPTIGTNQVKITVKDYLNFHKISYTNIIVNDDEDWKIEVKDTQTGEIKWIPFYGTYLSQFPNPHEPTDNERYVEIQNVSTVWVAHIKDNGNEIGQIYIDSESGEILKVIINDKVMIDILSKENKIVNYTAEGYYAAPQNTLDTTTAIALAITSILIIAGVVYWFKYKK